MRDIRNYPTHALRHYSHPAKRTSFQSSPLKDRPRKERLHFPLRKKCNPSGEEAQSLRACRRPRASRAWLSRAGDPWRK